MEENDITDRKNIPFTDYKKALFREDQELTKPYNTPRFLWEKGIIICEKCGDLASIDYKFCKRCNEQIFITIGKWRTENDIALEIWLRKKIAPSSEE